MTRITIYLRDANEFGKAIDNTKNLAKIKEFIRKIRDCDQIKVEE